MPNGTSSQKSKRERTYETKRYTDYNKQRKLEEYKCSWKALTASSGAKFLKVFTRSVYGAFFHKGHLENREIENLSNTVRKVENISMY